ncbi:unnamed protein product [Orchesella dallaii]|uniref:Uncharacterized protein n=1 Tax=Orchesella dallaii TaxID=48710 RepID=A0ABP1PJB0_9HEXA
MLSVHKSIHTSLQQWITATNYIPFRADFHGGGVVVVAGIGTVVGCVTVSFFHNGGEVKTKLESYDKRQLNSSFSYYRAVIAPLCSSGETCVSELHCRLEKKGSIFSPSCQPGSTLSSKKIVKKRVREAANVPFHLDSLSVSTQAS